MFHLVIKNKIQILTFENHKSVIIKIDHNIDQKFKNIMNGKEIEFINL